MYYKAKNVDTDKALEALEDARKYQENAARMELEKSKSYFKGVNRGLDIGKGIFECGNYEKEKEPGYEEGVLDTIRELGEQLDIPTQDLRNNFSFVDEICADTAERIRKKLEEDK